MPAPSPPFRRAECSNFPPAKKTATAAFINIKKGIRIQIEIQMRLLRKRPPFPSVPPRSLPAIPPRISQPLLFLSPSSFFFPVFFSSLLIET